ncbi:MAG: T9SS type A sorting domain-containing protein [Bacteroidia bacterium]|nr:T9SS type A sorting domain-containing protein [Bacteroidia bacterium]
MKKFLLLPLLLGLIGSAQAQQLLASAGESQSGTTVQLSYSLGELASQTLTSSVVLTQGFHQPGDLSTGVKKPLIEGMRCFPNPVSSHLTLTHASPGLYEWTIFEVQGRRVMGGNFLLAGQAEIPLPNLPEGTYLVHVTQIGTDAIFTQQFLKINP